MKSPSLRLVHKVLILLLLPAIIQAVLVVVLISLDDKAAHSAALAQRHSRAIKIIDEMLFDFGLTIGSLVTHVVGPAASADAHQMSANAEDNVKLSASAYRTKMSARLSALRETCSTSDERAVVDRASSLVEQQAAAIAEVENSVRSNQDATEGAAVWQQQDGVPSLSTIQKLRSLRDSLRNMGRFFESYRKLLRYNYSRQEMYLTEGRTAAYRAQLYCCGAGHSVADISFVGCLV